MKYHCFNQNELTHFSGPFWQGKSYRNPDMLLVWFEYFIILSSMQFNIIGGHNPMKLIGEGRNLDKEQLLFVHISVVCNYWFIRCIAQWCYQNCQVYKNSSVTYKTFLPPESLSHATYVLNNCFFQRQFVLKIMWYFLTKISHDLHYQKVV